MKKILAILALTLTAATMGYSQGQVNFNNRTNEFGFGDSRPVTFLNVPGQSNGAGVVGQNYVAQLYFASDAANPLATAAIVEAPSIFRIATTLNPGTWTGATKNFVGTVAQGNTVSLIVRAWDANIGTYAQNLASPNGITGQSAAFSYVVPTAGSAPGAYIMNNFQAFSVSPVPEPSTIALGLLGAGSLLFLRRKR